MEDSGALAGGIMLFLAADEVQRMQNRAMKLWYLWVVRSHRASRGDASAA